GRRIVEHGGGAEAFRHMYTRAPESRLAVAAFCDRADSEAAGKVEAAISLLLGPNPQAAAMSPATGVYRADSLPARYVLSRPDAQRATLALLPDGADHPAEVMQFTRTDDSGPFVAGALRLEATADGISISS